MARRASWLAWLLVTAPCLATAEDEPAPPDLELRAYEVRDLTMGRFAFDAEAGPTNVGTWPHDSLVFEGDDSVLPVGSIGDLIETVKAAGPSAMWDEKGSMISGTDEDLLVVRLPRAGQDRVEAVLARLRAEHLPALAIDVALVKGDPAAIAAPGSFPAAVAAGRVRVEGGARLVGQVGHRATAFAGRERAFVTGYDAQVAWNAKTVDPIVQIQPEGLAVEATVRAVAPTPTVDLRAWTARIVEAREATTAEGARFQALTVDAPVARANLRLQPGAWTILALSADGSLAIRATRLDPPASRPTAPFPRANLPATDPHAPPVPETERSVFDVNDLAARQIVRCADPIRLVGSDWAPEEPPELPEPCPFVPEDFVREAALSAVDPGAWSLEGARVEIRNRRMIVVHDAPHRKAVADVLAALRARFLGTLRFRATLVRLPLASFPEWVLGDVKAGGMEADSAIADGGRALLSRPGAEVVDSAAVRMPRRGARNASFAGAVRRYVRDYHAAVWEEGAVIGNPVVAVLRDGISLDVEAEVAAGGAGVQCRVRLDRATWEGLREAPTPHGVVECPDLALLRARAGLVVPFGATRLVGLAIEDGRATLVLLTANVE